ncbi:MAG: phosphoribosylglycinamide formyltransferase [Tenuifilaceae bacterium]
MNNIAIFASGSGTNAENIINHFKSKNIAKVTLILTENPNAYVLERAKNQNIKTIVFNIDELKGGFVLSQLKSQQIDYIVLAGFLKLFPAEIIDEFPHRIVNIHPALLPKFGGKGMYGEKVHKAVIESGDRESGISIHYVNKHYDEGNIIFQAKCMVTENDSPESLAQKIHALEYKYFPQVIEDCIKGKFNI